MAANTITASFGLDVNPLRTAANKASAIGRNIGQTFAKLRGPLVALGVALGAAFGVRAFADGLKGAFDLGGAMQDLTDQTGIAVREAFILRSQFADAGLAAEDLGGVVNKMQKTLGSDEGRKAIANLGLSFENLKNETPDVQFTAIGKAIATISDPAQRAQAAMALFGKSGGKLLALFADPDFGKGSDALQNQANILAKNSATFDQISDRLGRAGNILRGFFLGVADRVSATLLPLLDRLEQIDLTGIGQRFGDGMTLAVKAIQGGFSDPAALFGAALDFLRAGLLGAGNLFIAAIRFVGNLMAADTFLGSLTQGFLALEMIIVGTLMRAFEGPLKFFRDGLTFVAEQAIALFEDLQDKLTPGGSAAGNAKREANDEYLNKVQALRRKLTASGDASEYGMPITDKGRRETAALEQSKPISAFGEGRSFAEIQKANAGEKLEVFGVDANDMVTKGSALLNSGIKDFFTAATEAFKKTGVEDVLGAKGALADAVAKAKGLAGKTPVVSGGNAPSAALPVKKPFAGSNLLTGEELFSAGVFNGKGAGPATGLSSSGLKGSAVNKSFGLSKPGTQKLEVQQANDTAQIKEIMLDVWKRP